MIKLSELVVNFVLNASWQIAALALAATIGARLLQNASARYRHWLWVAALVLSVALPIWTLLPNTQSPQLTAQRIAQETLASQHSTSSPNTRSVIAAPTAITVTPVSTNLVVKNRLPDAFTDPRLFLLLSSVYLLFLFYRAARLWSLWRRTQLLKRTAYERHVPELMQAVARQCFASLKLARVSMKCSSSTATAGVVGGRSPLIVLPESFFKDLPEETLYSILGHEMAHIARRDFPMNLIYEILLLPISFHPLSRFIKQQIDRTRELACDEMVTDKLLEPIKHARSLVSIAGALMTPSERLLTLGIFDANILEERIMKLTRKSRRFGLWAARVLTVTTVSVLCALSLAISSFSFELHANQKAVRSSQNLVATQSTAQQLPPLTHSQSGQSLTIQQPTRTGAEQTEANAAQERAQAACDAGRKQSVESIPELIAMLGDDRKTTLIRCWTNGRWTPALETFKQPSPGEQAAIALASMGTPAVEPLTVALSNQNTSVRRNAAWAIGELTNMGVNERSDAVVPLITLLGDSDAWVRMAAARALGEVRDERSADQLIAGLVDSHDGVRQTSAWALGEMKDARAVQALCTVVVSDRQIEVRVAAAEALGEIRNEKAVPSLKQALNDSEARVRAKATWALDEILDS